MKRNDDITCALPIEVISRELDSKIYLALNCLKEGFSNVVIGSREEVFNFMISGEYPYVFLSKGAHRESDIYDKIEKSGGFYTVLDAEGAVFSPFSDKFNYRNASGFNKLDRMKRVFIWGERAYSSIPETEISDKHMIVGNPTFDICKSVCKPFYETISKVLDKPYILVNTAFGSVNNFLSLEDELKIWKGSEYDPNSNIEEYYSAVYKYEEKLFLPFLEGIRKIASDFPDEQIVIRPHPSEKIETYQEYFHDCANIKVIREGSVQSWISNAKLIIHQGSCTTAIEAFLNGRDVVAFTPYYEAKHTPDVPYRISEVANDYEELKSLIDRKVNKKEPLCINREDKLNIIKEIIDNIDYDSGSVIAEELFKLGKEVALLPRMNMKSKKMALKNKLRPYLGPIKRFILNSSNQTTGAQKRKEIKFPSLSKKELEIRIEGFNKCGFDFPKIKIEKIDSDTYILHSACRK